MDLSRIEWRTSSYSSSNGGQCVQVGTSPQIVAVRDSQDPAGPALIFTPGDWRVFLGHLKDDQADLA